MSTIVNQLRTPLRRRPSERGIGATLERVGYFITAQKLGPRRLEPFHQIANAHRIRFAVTMAPDRIGASTRLNQYV